MSETKEAKKAKKAEKKAAKKGKKSGKGFKIVIAVLLVIAIAGEFYIGLTIPGKIENAITAATSATSGDESNDPGIEFKEGTYGGKCRGLKLFTMLPLRELHEPSHLPGPG